MLVWSPIILQEDLLFFHPIHNFRLYLFSNITQAHQWAINKENILDETKTNILELEKNNIQWEYSLYNRDIMSFRHPNDYWENKSKYYFEKSVKLANFNLIDSISYLKEAAYANPNNKIYFELAEKLFELKDYSESMNSYIISADLGYENKSYAYYNAACAASMANDLTNGLMFLKMALDEGYSHWNYLEKDNDISFLRESDSFRNLINEYK